MAYTLNHCLKYAKGKYIARMDDDDESEIERLEIQVNFLENNFQYDLVSCNIKLFDDDGIFAQKTYPSIVTEESFLFNSPIVHPAVLARKKCFDIVGGYSEESVCVRVEDYDIFMRMFEKGIRMYVIQKFLFFYRDDNQTIIRRQKYKYRINEFIVRLRGFSKLKLYPKGFVYVLKPLILGCIPSALLKKMKGDKIEN